MGKKPTKEQFRQLLINEIAAWELRKCDHERKRDSLPPGCYEWEREREEVAQCAARHSYAGWLLTAFDGEVPIPEY
ncbi:MAG: hypothetical protein ACOY4Q_13515 [Bacillota bacterium]